MRIEKGMHGQWKIFTEGKIDHIGVVVKIAGWNASKDKFPTKEAAAYQLEKDWKGEGKGI